MPTLTFYADDETAKMLDELLKEKSKRAGFKISSGKLFAAHIRDEHKRLCHPIPLPAPVEKKRAPRRKVESIQPVAEGAL